MSREPEPGKDLASREEEDVHQARIEPSLSSNGPSNWSPPVPSQGSPPGPPAPPPPGQPSAPPSPPSEDIIIEAQGLSKSYKMVLGLTDVYLQIPKGITGLLGPNGAGKSTFIKLMLGLIHPTVGKVSIMGVDPAKVDVFSKIGYVPEHEAYIPWMTGQEYVTFYLRLQGLTKNKAQARADHLLAGMELKEEARGRKLATYSRGMGQKVKLARALGHDPDLLILDEPFQGTDPSTRKLMMENIRVWAERGKSVLISSHILQDVESLTDNIVLINQGRVLAHGHRRSIREMIEHIPQRVVVVPQDPADRHRLAHALLNLPSVQKIELTGGGGRSGDPGGTAQGGDPDPLCRLLLSGAAPIAGGREDSGKRDRLPG